MCKVNLDTFCRIKFSSSIILNSYEVFVLLILLGVLAISIVETVIFQVFLFWVLSWVPFIKNWDYLIILIASMIFGLNHPNGITYIVGTAIIGLLYNDAY